MCKFTAKIYIPSVSNTQLVKSKFCFLKFTWWFSKVIAAVTVLLS